MVLIIRWLTSWRVYTAYLHTLLISMRHPSSSNTISQSKQRNKDFQRYVSHPRRVESGRGRRGGGGWVILFRYIGFRVHYIPFRSGALRSSPIVNDARRYRHAATQLLLGSMALELSRALGSRGSLTNGNFSRLTKTGTPKGERERDYCNLIPEANQPLARG